jgi:hypothetical protein
VKSLNDVNVLLFEKAQQLAGEAYGLPPIDFFESIGQNPAAFFLIKSQHRGRAIHHHEITAKSFWIQMLHQVIQMLLGSAEAVEVIDHEQDFDAALFCLAASTGEPWTILVILRNGSRFSRCVELRN